MMRYVIVTAARNEARHIDKTLQSVVSQTALPLRWIIVDDGSTDNTLEIIATYARRHEWIQLQRRAPRAQRSFTGKAEAVNNAWRELQELPFEVFVNLDGDISFEPDYFEYLLARLAADPQLGVAGTPFTQDGGYDSTRDSFEGENYVAGPCQLFRRECFQEIGGYIPNRAGGLDWTAVMTARMKGWKARSFSEKRFHHHRRLGTAERGDLQALFSYGQKDYWLGGSPVWQLCRVTYRMAKRPVLLGGLALLSGYCWAALRRAERAVSPELMRFHREEQKTKLRAIFRTILRLKKVDSFRLATSTENRAKDLAPRRDIHTPEAAVRD